MYVSDDQHTSNIQDSKECNSPATSQLLERDYEASLINECPARDMLSSYDQFWSSRCSRSQSISAYSIRCSKYNQNKHWDLDFKCLGAAVCVDRYVRRPRNVAICLEEGEKQHINFAGSNKGVFQLKFSMLDSVDEPFSAEFVLTDAEGRKALEAPLMTVTPASSSNTQIGKTILCENCSSLRYIDAPANLRTFYVNVTLPREESDGESDNDDGIDDEGAWLHAVSWLDNQGRSRKGEIPVRELSIEGEERLRDTPSIWHRQEIA